MNFAQNIFQICNEIIVILRIINIQIQQNYKNKQ